MERAIAPMVSWEIAHTLHIEVEDDAPLDLRSLMADLLAAWQSVASERRAWENRPLYLSTDHRVQSW
jgi:hypothetical protein